MSLISLVWLVLIYIGFGSAQEVSLEPSCANPQGVYLAKEGERVEVCFTLPRVEGFRIPQTVNFVTQNKSTLGSVATGNVDYVDGTFSINVNIGDQDIITVCQSIQINSDNLIERTEYFTVSLRRSMSDRELATCQVAITDRNGGPSECYNSTVTGADVRQSQIMNDTRFCFMGNFKNGLIDCEVGPNFAFADCTNWNQSMLNSLVSTGARQGQLLPNISTISQTCFARVFEVMETMYRTERGDSNPPPPPPRLECVTNCVLTVTNEEDCEASVLLLERVHLLEAMESMTSLRSESPDVCKIGVECCGLSRPLPPICRESPPRGNTVTGAAEKGVEESQAILIGSVTGAAVGLVLLGGTIIAIVVLLVVCLVYVSKRKLKASVVEKPADADCETNGSVDGTLDTPLFNPIYDDQNPPDYEMVASTEISVKYAKWKQLFSGMIISPNNLRLGALIGEGAFGKVYRGTLKTPSAVHGANFTTQRNIAVKRLKKASIPEEIEDFIAESAIMLDFNHPNILRLVGVCFDTEDTLPMIILPYMANGDLRTFLKSKIPKNDSATNVMPEGLSEAVLMGMCTDIAFGMAYLAKRKFVHRDLAARNCMVDGKLSVKVADFGLSRDVYRSDYYRLTHRQRLPVRWMPPESIFDSLHTEKSDVWAYGTVCWEVFTLGQKPYSGLENADIPDYISHGQRLGKPHLCPDKLYDLMMKTWREERQERPTFNQIVERLVGMTGTKRDQQMEEPMYFAIEELINTSNHESDEEDVGGVHVYTEVESPLYNNFSSMPEVSVPPVVPEEYEIPVTAAGRSTPQNSETINGERVVPIDYEVPVSSLPRSADQTCSSVHSVSLTSSSSDKQQLEESECGHAYHTLEPPTGK